MTNAQTTRSARPAGKGRKPQVVIDAAQLEHLEALAEGAMSRTPDLAETLLTELSRAKVVPTAKLPADVVTIGRPVTWRDQVSGKDQTATLVWPEEADIAAGKISVMTPIGVALIGLPAGANFPWVTRTGETRELTVLEVGNA